MAILRGFPPSNTISPSVRITEKDLSFIAPSASFHRAGLVGFASKGPINLPTVIRTQRELNTVFGYPHPEVGDPYLIYAAQQYLLVANELYVVRVADTEAVSDEQATVASAEVPAAGESVSVVSNAASLYIPPTDQFIRWRLNGVLASKMLSVPPKDGDYTTVELVAELNDQLDATVDGIEFYEDDGGNVAVKTVWAYGPTASFEWVSVQNDAYDTLGVGTTMTSAVTTGTATYFPDDGYHSAGDWTFTDALTLKIVVDGTDNVLIDNVVQEVSFADLIGGTQTTKDIVDLINSKINDGTATAIPGGFTAVGGGADAGPIIYLDDNGDPVYEDLTTAKYTDIHALEQVSLVTLHKGRDARLLVKSDSTADVALGLSNITAAGDSPEGIGGSAASYEYGLLTGPVDATTKTFTLTADSSGIEGNNTTIKITNDITEGVFTLEVYNNDVQMESWGYLTKDASSRYYVEVFLALTSDFVRVIDNTNTLAMPADGEYDLSGGSDGIPSDPDTQDELLIGNLVGYSGLYALSEPEQIDIDLIAIPGHASTNVVYALLDFAQNVRMDCLAIIDPPFGLTVKEITHWQNGSHPLNTTRFNSDFGALYWPWVKIRDTYNRVDVWVPPSGAVMAAYARSDNLAASWYAPAGSTRGIVPIDDVFNRPTLEERDLMYGNRNCINPIVQFADVQDFVIWGQKTLQRRPTALDRVNVRRMMFYIEKNIRAASRGMLFDPHDDEFHLKWENLARAVLDEVRSQHGLTAYIIDAGWDLNTPDVVDRNEFRARIGVQPTRAVEFIFIEFSVHRTGSFSETTEQPYYS